MPASEDDFPGIVIGKDLAASIGALPGDMVTLVTPQGSLSPMGVMPRQRRFKVVGTFQLGLFEFDQSYGFVSLDSGMRLAGTDRVDHLELKVADIYQAPRISDDIVTRFGDDVRDAGLGRHEQVALLGAAAREDRHGDRHRPHRDGRRAQHRGVAHPAGDGEDAATSPS